MLRHSARFGLFSIVLGGITVACGSSDDVPSPGGSGGFSFGGAGGFPQGGLGGALGGSSGTSFGGTASGGFPFGGFPASGGFPGNGGIPGNGGAAGAGTGGALVDGGVVDGSLDGSIDEDASASGGSGSGGKAGSGGAPDEDASVPYCGNGVKDGTDACDEGGVDTAACDADCTKPSCGDKHVNTAAGEVCDDGNGTPGDGCSNCQLENTCPAPVAVQLKETPAGSGTVTGNVNGDTTDKSSHVNPAVCDGNVRGSGPDALYSFTLDRARKVQVSLDAPSFDGILRAYTTACVPGASLSEPGKDSCSNTGGGTESLTYPRLDKGTYFVVVDGAGGSDRGAFSLGITATCDGTDDLRIVEVGIGAPDYAVIRNMSDCPADLTGVKVKFDDPTEADVVTTLPSLTLAPGEQLRIQEGLLTSSPGIVPAGGAIAFDSDRGGTVLVCKTDCATAADVVDVFEFADGEPSTLEPPPPPPGPLTFAFPVKGIDGSNENTKSFVRVKNDGKSPSFTGADFCTGTPNAPFGLRLEEVFLGNPDFVSMKNVADCPVQISPYQVRFETGGVGTPIDAVLGSRTLAAGATAYLSEPPNKLNDINVGKAIPNQGGVAGTVRLCLGVCTGPGATVDAVAWDGVSSGGGTPSSFPALPGPITFTPDGLQTITDANEGTLSYRRTGRTGNNPRFFAADWAASAKSR